MGLREERPLEPTDSLHSPHPFGLRCVPSIYILIAVSPFGDPSVRKRVKSSLSLFFFFWWEVIESLCCHQCSLACMDSIAGHDHVVSSLIITPCLSLLVHSGQGPHTGGATSVCLYHCAAPTCPLIFRQKSRVHAQCTQDTGLIVSSPSTASHEDVGSVLPPPHPATLPHSNWRSENRGRGVFLTSQEYPPLAASLLSVIWPVSFVIVGAKVQVQRQIRRLIPHSKPSLRDARRSDT